MKQTKDSLTTQSHEMEFSVSISEQDVCFVIKDISNGRMLPSQMSLEEAEIFTHFMAKRLGINYFKDTVTRQGALIESMADRNEELRQQLSDLSERANIIFSDYEAGNMISGEDMTKLKEESQKAEYLIEKR